MLLTLFQIKLYNALCNIVDWCATWQMEINIAKTFAIQITNKNQPLSFQYSIGDATIKTVSEVKYLGLTISANLKWHLHIDNVCAKALKKLCFLRRKLVKSTPTVRLNAYLMLIRPVMEYASIVWDAHLKKDIDKLERIQRLSARFIVGDYRHASSVTAILQYLGLEPLYLRRKISRLKFLYSLKKRVLGLNPDVYIHPIAYRSVRLNHDQCIQPYVPRVDVFKYSFFVRTIDEWNSLPSSCVNATTTELFEQTLRRYLCEV